LRETTPIHFGWWRAFARHNGQLAKPADPGDHLESVPFRDVMRTCNAPFSPDGPRIRRPWRADRCAEQTPAPAKVDGVVSRKLHRHGACPKVRREVAAIGCLAELTAEVLVQGVGNSERNDEKRL